jgi:DNA topoisomerase-1
MEETTSGFVPPLKLGQSLERKEIIAQERFTRSAPRYTEASLVKKLEELGIGRPSTYAPTISTIQQRGYVIKEDRPGNERNYDYLILTKDKISHHKKTEITGAEKAKLFPDNIGMVVNDFLVDYFKEILDYGFTAAVEKEFDDIAEGQIKWPEMLHKFYTSFHKQVEKTLEESEVNKGERVLGKDPETGDTVLVRLGRYGALVQIGEKEGSDKKPKYASLRKGQNMESITLEEALELFNLPRSIGDYENSELVVSIGRYGPYVRHDSKFYSLAKDDDPYKITKERAIEIIELKREREKNKYIKRFKEDDTLAVLNGRWGPYLVKGTNNYRLPKGTEAKELSYKDCLKIIEEAEAKKKKK